MSEIEEVKEKEDMIEARVRCRKFVITGNFALPRKKV